MINFPKLRRNEYNFRDLFERLNRLARYISYTDLEMQGNYYKRQRLGDHTYITSLC